MAPRRSVTLLVGIAMAVAVLGPANAGPDHNPLGGTAVVPVAPGATGTVTSGEFSGKISDADIFFGSDVGDTEAFRNVALLLLGIESDKRNVGCLNFGALTSQSLMDELDDRVRGDALDTRAAVRGAAVALMCLRIARLLAEIEAEAGISRPATTPARATPCRAIPFKVQVQTTRAEDGSYVLTTRAGVKDVTRTAKAKYTCTTKNGKVRLHIHPKRKATLRKIVGKRVQVGLANPSTAESTTPVRVTFKGK